MTQRFANVVSARPKKLQMGVVKSVSAADRGSLEVSPQAIEFTGREAKLSLNRVEAVEWLGVEWSRIQLLGVIALLAGALWVLAGSEQGWVRLLWAAFLVPTALVWFWRIASTKWVQVDSRDESGSRKSAYFQDGSYRGFGGLLGGTKDLYAAIRTHGPGGALAAEGDLSALASRRRRRGRLLRSALAVWVCALVVVGLSGSYVGTYGFLAEGPEPSATPSDPGSLYVSTGADTSGILTDFYCFSSHGEFAQFVTIKNTGPVPVTIYGEPPDAGWFSGQVDLALYRNPLPTDPRTANTFESKTLGANESIEVWARFNADALAPGNELEVRSKSGLWVEYSVLWEKRVARIATRPRQVQPRCTAG